MENGSGGFMGGARVKKPIVSTLILYYRYDLQRRYDSSSLHLIVQVLTPRQECSASGRETSSRDAC